MFQQVLHRMGYTVEACVLDPLGEVIGQGVLVNLFRRIIASVTGCAAVGPAVSAA